jgi:hypothetical protein
MLEEVNPFASGSEENILIPVWEKWDLEIAKVCH